jgi:S1-C subfamily serine protease
MPVTANVYQRVLRVETSSGGGSAFTLDHDGTQFLVTAEHVVASQPDAVTMTLGVLGEEQQVTLRRLPGVTGGADIAVFELPERITPADQPVVASFDEIFYTQDVYFLGYPFGLGLRRPQLGMLPFVKKGILSASVETDEGGHLLYVDGLNNPGFSGGPVAFYTLGADMPHIAGVVSGYLPDERHVSVGGQEIDASVLENTGIIVAYDIKHAVAAMTVRE